MALVTDLKELYVTEDLTALVTEAIGHVTVLEIDGTGHVTSLFAEAQNITGLKTEGTERTTDL